MCTFVQTVSRSGAGLPQSDTETLFEVFGLVEILGIVGEITEALESVSNASTLDVAGVTAWSGQLAGNSPPNFVGYSAGSGRLVEASARGKVTNGDVTLTCPSSNYGEVAWYLWYLPLSPGATVTAV